MKINTNLTLTGANMVKATVSPTGGAKSIGVDANGNVLLAAAIGFADERATRFQPQQLTPEKRLQFMERDVARAGSTLIPAGGYARVESNRAYGFSGDWSGGGASQTMFLDDGRWFNAQNKDGANWDNWKEIAPINRTNPSAYFGQQDYSDRVVQDYSWGAAGTIAYVNRNLQLNGANCAARFEARIPAVKNAIYRVHARVKKISGTGTTYVGFSRFSNVNYNVGAWNESNVQAVGNTRDFIHEYTYDELLSSNKIDANTQYVDFVVLGNYSGLGTTQVEFVKIEFRDAGNVQQISSSMVTKSGEIANFNANAAAAIGAVVINTKIPQNSATMFRFNVEGYEYTGLSAWEISFGGYMYIANDFYNHVAQGYRKPSATAGYYKLGLRNGFVCIIIGTATTSWAYPKILVKDIMLGHAGGNLTATNGWNITMEDAATLATITNQTNLNIA